MITSKKQYVTFEIWIKQCADLALLSEFIVDEENPGWLKLYKGGITPKYAVKLKEMIDFYRSQNQ